MNPDYFEDELTRLRLRLNETELQRDAFKAMARKEVFDLIRDVLEVNPLIAEYKAHRPVLGMAYDPSPNWGKPATPKPRRRRG